MSHAKAAAVIAAKLREGVIYPGNVKANQPPATLMLPGMRTVGMPPQMVEAVANTTRLIAEGLVAALETDAGLSLIDTAELEQLRQDAQS